MASFLKWSRSMSKASHGSDDESDDGDHESPSRFRSRVRAAKQASSKKNVVEVDVRRLSEQVGALREGERLNMRAVILLMWRAKTKPLYVRVISDILKKRHADKKTFDGVEFFLPQLVHMLIHLEVDWPEDVLQEFTLMVCQVSLHFALQMYWVLVGAMEDAQPEKASGAANKNADPNVFLRCSMLLYALERAVVYGDNPEVTELEAAFANNKLSKAELDEALREARLQHAKKLVDAGADEEATLEGELQFKRWARSNAFASKGWKTRRFVLKNRLLLCYRVADGALKRAIPLHNAEVVEKAHHSHDFYFEVHENGTDRVFKLAAKNARTCATWIKELRKAASRPPLFSAAEIDGLEMTPAQEARFHFFKAETDFVKRLTDVSESLRLTEAVAERKGTLKRAMLRIDADLDPEMGLYLPIVKSTDEFKGIVKASANANRAFSTRERCPVLLTFETTTAKLGADGKTADVANFIHDRYGEQQEERFGDRLRAMLSIAATRASLWEHDDTVTAMARTAVPSEAGVVRVIAKSHDDVRQEVFIMQLITFLHQTWSDAALGLWVMPYTILSTGATTGLIEVVEDATSIDGLKSTYMESDGRDVPLLEHFERTYTTAATMRQAKKRFTESIAGYSIATYVLGIKDRHNGNLMLRTDGRIVHIDFGFVLGMAPGKDKIAGTNFSLERAAFKLTNEMVDVMGGVDSDNYAYFCELCKQGVLAVRDPHMVDVLTTLIEVSGYKSKLPCFTQPHGGVDRALKEIKARLFLDAGSEDEVRAKVDKLIKAAKQHTGTMLYEKFQAKSNGIRPMH